MTRKTGIILSLLTIILEIFSTLLIVPLLTRYVGKSEYGVYKMCISIISYVMLLDLGMGNSVIRFASKLRTNNDNTGINKLTGTITIFYTAISVLSLIIGTVILFIFPVVFSKGLTSSEIQLAQKMIFFITIYSAITLFSSGFMNLIIAYEKFIVTKGFQIIQIIIKFILSIIAIKSGYGCLGVIVINFLTIIPLRIAYILYVIFALKIKPSIKSINKSFIKEIFIFSSFIFIQMIATQLNQTVDQILIGSLVENSSSILGEYGLASQLNQYLMSIGSAITGVLMPGIIRTVEKNKNSKDVINKEITSLSRLVFYPMVLIYFGFVLIGKEFIILWSGDDYINSYYVCMILMFPQIFIYPISLLTQVLWALNEQKELSIIKITIVLVNILVTIVLININPLFGASIGTLISLFLGDIFTTLILCNKKLKLDLFEYFKKVFFANLFVCFILLMLFKWIKNMFTFNYLLNLIIYGGCFLMFYTFISYFCILSKKEKSILLKWRKSNG